MRQARQARLSQMRGGELLLLSFGRVFLRQKEEQSSSMRGRGEGRKKKGAAQ